MPASLPPAKLDHRGPQYCATNGEHRLHQAYAPRALPWSHDAEVRRARILAQGTPRRGQQHAITPVSLPAAGLWASDRPNSLSSTIPSFMLFNWETKQDPLARLRRRWWRSKMRC